MPITLSGDDGVDQSNVSGATTIPRGTTAERPANPVDGMIRYNTDEGYIEYYDGIQELWLPTSDTEKPIEATGGTVTDITQDGVNYRVHTFTSSGTFDVTFAPENAEVECLVVAGGGGGARSDQNGAGAGGAGGYLEGTFTVAPSNQYTVQVGAGGSGKTVESDGSNGSDSAFSTATAVGGGGGGVQTGLNGGSGGGGGDNQAAGVATQNNSGGLTGYGNDGAASGDGGAGGGGGGAGGAGGLTGSLTPIRRNGGLGKSSSINGNEVAYSAGGDSQLSTQGESGLPNTGNGGEGGFEKNSGAGGSGIVIIRYLI